MQGLRLLHKHLSPTSPPTMRLRVRDRPTPSRLPTTLTTAALRRVLQSHCHLHYQATMASPIMALRYTTQPVPNSSLIQSSVPAAQSCGSRETNRPWKLPPVGAPPLLCSQPIPELNSFLTTWTGRNKRHHQMLCTPLPRHLHLQVLETNKCSIL